MRNNDTLSHRSEDLAAVLHRDTLPTNPFELFSDWFDQTLNSEWPDVNGMVVATVGENGLPSQRTVLMKSFDADSLYFYTNYHSRKARALEHNPEVSCLFFWPVLSRQVEFQGIVHKVEPENSAQYFATRPRSSQVGAWASRQSEELPDRKTLEDRVHKIEKRFAGEKVPLPDFWGGYRVVPDRVEFWQGRASRLHDRFAYTRDRSDASKWSLVRLYP